MTPRSSILLLLALPSAGSPEATLESASVQASVQEPPQESATKPAEAPAAGELLLGAELAVEGLVLRLVLDRASGLGLAVGGSGGNDDPGLILRSADGGDSWQPVASPSPARLYDLAFVDEHETTSSTHERATIVAVGLAGQVLRSTDQGRSWTARRAGPEWLSGVAFATSRRGFAVGGQGAASVCLSSADGGQSWSVREDVRGASFFRAIEFRDARHGLIVGDQGSLLSTEDGGEHWQQAEVEPVYLRGIDASPDGTDWVVGSPGVLLRREAGESKWSRRPFPTSEKLNGVRFLDARTGLVTTMDGKLFLTRDRAASWELWHETSHRHLVDLALPSAEGPGFVVGDGLLLRLEFAR